MKFGIITLPVNYNFGGILQAYALQTILSKLGHEGYIINPDYGEPRGILEKVLTYSPRIFRKYILHQNIPIKKEFLRKAWFNSCSKNTYSFICKHLNLYTIHNLKDLNKSDFDGFIIGSDQIWRKKFTSGLFGVSDIYDVFGAFLNKKKNRIFAYAPSFGVDSIEDYNQKDFKRISKILKNYTGVSCREDSGTELLKTYFSCPCARTVLDPTLLLDREDYMSLLNIDNEESRSEIVSYILDRNKKTDRVINKIENLLNKHSVEINNQTPGTPQYHVEYWLKSIANSDFVVTDSFHATVFAIIFQKPFLVIANSSRGVSRLDNLLSKFGLEDRLINDADDKSTSSLAVDLSSNDDVILKLREDSLNFLTDSIAKIQK